MAFLLKITYQPPRPQDAISIVLDVKLSDTIGDVKQKFVQLHSSKTAAKKKAEAITPNRGAFAAFEDSDSDEEHVGAEEEEEEVVAAQSRRMVFTYKGMQLPEDSRTLASYNILASSDLRHHLRTRFRTGGSKIADF